MKDLKIYIFIASALFIVYLVAQYNKPKPVDWTETFRNNDKIPFGTYVLYNRLHDIFPNSTLSSFREPVYNVINNQGIEKSTYIIICNYAKINKDDYDKLIEYIKNGNDLFIAANAFGPYLQKKLNIETGYEMHSGDAVRIGFVNKSLNINKYAINKNTTNSYFSNFDTSKAVVISENEFHHSNYIKFKMGAGTLYLSSNPLMFTNYSLLQDQGAAYASIALSHLKNNKNLIWDEYYSMEKDGDQSTMGVFLRNAPLRWAFYIAYFSLLAFVLFEMKRRQRIIPVIAPLNNTTIDFARVVGQVYYEQRNNANIAEKKISYFLEYIRTKFYIKTNVLDDDFIKNLSQKSGVNLMLIQELFHQIMLVRSGQRINDHELISLNKNIEQFYHQSS